MKKEFKMYGYAIACIFFIAGIYLLGQAGAGFLSGEDGKIQGQSDEGELFSLNNSALIRFIAGFVITIIGVFLYLIFLKKKNNEEDF